MPKMADMTSAARSPPETPPGPAWVRASTPAGWRPPRPTRRRRGRPGHPGCRMPGRCGLSDRVARRPKSDRKSTRLNSSHLVISYAVFCLKKKIEPLVTRRQDRPPLAAAGFQLVAELPAERAIKPEVAVRVIRSALLCDLGLASALELLEV